jgi:hypothetical protein
MEVIHKLMCQAQKKIKEHFRCINILPLSNMLTTLLVTCVYGQNERVPAMFNKISTETLILAQLFTKLRIFGSYFKLPLKFTGLNLRPSKICSFRHLKIRGVNWICLLKTGLAL